MYCRIIVLQGIYMKHMEMESKCATRKAQNRKIKRRPTYMTNLGQPLTKPEPRPTSKLTTQMRSWGGTA